MAEMRDIYLSEGPDVYVHDSNDWRHIHGLGGDDTLSYRQGSLLIGGPGNDTLINATGNREWGGAAYWNSPGPITVNFAEGYALDGYGTRDRLIDIHHVHSSGQHGDLIIGSPHADSVWINGFDWSHREAAGSMRFYGGAGHDHITTQGPSTSYRIEVASDGRSVVMQRGGYTAYLYDVEALWFWNEALNRHDEFRVIDLIDASVLGVQTLLAPGQRAWGGALGQPVELTYSFMSAVPAYGGGEAGSGFVEATPAYRAAVREILAGLSIETGLRFREVGDTATSFGQLRFGANQQADTKGYAFMPEVGDDRAGDVWLDVETLAALGRGQEGWQALLHEIGHALGLSHPYSADTPNAPVPTLLDRWNHAGLTVMSSEQPASGLWQTGFGPLDLQALRHLYGPGPGQAARAGNDTYRYTDADGLGLVSLSDSGGWDTIDLSGVSVGAYVDLTPGSFSSVGITPWMSAAIDNLYITPGTLIESVIGTRQDDVLIGNEAANVFLPGQGNDLIDGRGGFDVVVMPGRRADYTIDRLAGSGHHIVEHRNGASGAKELIRIERVQFDDGKVALDVEAGAAGMAARLVGALLGPQFVKDRQVASVALWALADAGMSASQVAQLGIDSPLFAQLGGGASHADFVATIYRNVTGVSQPSAQAIAPYVAWLDARVHSKSSLTLMAADTAANLARIDYVGLIASGFDYL